MENNSIMKFFIYLVLITFSINSTRSQITNIPDVEFESLLINSGIDKSGILDGKINSSEIETLNKLKIFTKGKKIITDLTGIEGFKNLKHLDLRNCSLSSLDLSENTMLETLNVSDSNISMLDLQSNLFMSKVKSLGNNTIESLDIRGSLNLEELSLNKCMLKNVSFGNNSSLLKVYLEKNELKSIDVSEAINLKYLDFDENMISVIDFSNNLKLKSLSFSKNNISGELDFSKHYFLERLELRSNKIIKINVNNDNNSILRTFVVYNNPLTCIQIDGGSYRGAPYNNWKTGLPVTVYSTNCF